jgi:hypothetical protein
VSGSLDAGYSDKCRGEYSPGSLSEEQVHQGRSLTFPFCELRRYVPYMSVPCCMRGISSSSSKNLVACSGPVVHVQTRTILLLFVDGRNGLQPETPYHAAHVGFYTTSCVDASVIHLNPGKRDPATLSQQFDSSVPCDAQLSQRKQEAHRTSLPNSVVGRASSCSASANNSTVRFNTTKMNNIQTGHINPSEPHDAQDVGEQS